MDLADLPLEIQKHIFVPDFEETDTLENLNQTRDLLVLVRTIRLVCKRWKRLAERLPVSFSLKAKDTAEDVRKYARIFPSCRTARVLGMKVHHRIRKLMIALDDLAVLNTFSKLDTIRIMSHRQCDTAQIASLDCLTRLRRLYFSYRRESADVSPVLFKACRSLRVLVLRCANLVNFTQFDIFDSLRSLSLPACKYPSGVLTSLSSLRTLRLLSLPHMLDHNDAMAIAKLTQLESLEILARSPNSFESSTVIQYLTTLRKLHFLSLPQLITDDQSLALVQPFSNLTHLSSMGSPPPELSATALIALSQRVPRLCFFSGLMAQVRNDEMCSAYCSFSRMSSFVSPNPAPPLTDTGFARLASLRDVSQICIPTIGLGVHGMEAICSRRNLQLLRLHGTAASASSSLIPSHSFYQLSKLTGLTDLELTFQSSFPADGVECLRSSHLRRVDLRGTPVTSVNALSICSSLTYLAVPQTPLSDNELKVLKKLPHLRSLNVEGLQLNGECFIDAVYATCMRDLRIRSLVDRDQPQISLAGGHAIAKFTLLWDLNWNFPIALDAYEVLIRNVSFSRIYLHHPTRMHLEATLQHCTRLASLYLRGIEPLKVTCDEELLALLSPLRLLTNLNSVIVHGVIGQSVSRTIHRDGTAAAVAALGPWGDSSGSGTSLRPLWINIEKQSYETVSQ